MLPSVYVTFGVVSQNPGEEAGKALLISIFKNTHIVAALGGSQPRNSMRGSAFRVEKEFLDSKPGPDYLLNDFGKVTSLPSVSSFICKIHDFNFHL